MRRSRSFRQDCWAPGADLLRRPVPWRRQAESGGIDVVIDGAPGSSLSSYMRSFAMGARVVVYGSTGKPKIELNAPDLFLRHATIFGTAMGSPQDFSGMLEFVDSHGVKPIIDRTFEFSKSVEALNYLQDDHGFGKVAITFGGAGHG